MFLRFNSEKSLHSPEIVQENKVVTQQQGKRYPNFIFKLMSDFQEKFGKNVTEIIRLLIFRITN